MKEVLFSSPCSEYYEIFKFNKLLNSSVTPDRLNSGKGHLFRANSQIGYRMFDQVINEVGKIRVTS